MTKDRVAQHTARAEQTRLDAFLGESALPRKISTGQAIEIFSSDQCAIGGVERVQTRLQQLVQGRVAII